jgi:prepilin-type processing-associated H-X9-DG protein
MAASALIHVSAVETPSTTVLVGDGPNDGSNFLIDTKWCDQSGSGSIGGINNSATPRTLNTLRERHLDTINTLYCDGHVKAVKLDSLVVTSTGAFTNKWAPFTINTDPT